MKQPVKKETHILNDNFCNNKRVICIDIDNVIAFTDRVIRAIIFQYTDGRVNLAYKDIINFDYCKAIDSKGNSISQKEWIEIHRLFSLPQNLARIKPYPNIQAHLSALSTRYNIHFVTSRLKSGWLTTLRWLERYRIPCDGIHFVKRLEKHTFLTNIFAIIEDDYEQALHFSELGTNAYIIEHPWNTGKLKRDNMIWMAEWEDIVKKLMNK